MPDHLLGGGNADCPCFPVSDGRENKTESERHDGRREHEPPAQHQRGSQQSARIITAPVCGSPFTTASARLVGLRARMTVLQSSFKIPVAKQHSSRPSRDGTYRIVTTAMRMILSSASFAKSQVRYTEQLSVGTKAS